MAIHTPAWRTDMNLMLDTLIEVKQMIGSPSDATREIHRAVTLAIKLGKQYDKRQSPYGEMCRNPDSCQGKGYCPLDPTCGD